MKYKWSLNTDGYAKCGFTDKILFPGKVQNFRTMHKLVFPGKEGMVVDHIDGNKLNNQKKNLRLITHSDNCASTGRYKNNESGFKGIYKTESGKFAAKLSYNKKQIHIGVFSHPKEAAEAYTNKLKSLRKIHMRSENVVF